MLFNSYPFVFIFLPLVLLGFAALTRWATRRAVLGFLIVAFAVFVMVRQANRIKSAFDTPPPAAAPTTKECPFCISTISLKARRCPNCTSELSGAAT